MELRLRPGFERDVAADPAMLAACMGVAAEVAAAAQDLARSEAYRTGAYAAGIVAAVGESALNPGPTAQVQGTDFKSRWIEFGFTSEGVPRPPKAILRRAGESLGYRFAVRS